MPFGHWIIKEISSPSALYSISPEQHHVYIGTDGQTIEIEIDNIIMPVVITDFVNDMGSERGKGAFGSTGK